MMQSSVVRWLFLASMCVVYLSGERVEASSSSPKSRGTAKNMNSARSRSSTEKRQSRRVQESGKGYTPSPTRRPTPTPTPVPTVAAASPTTPGPTAPANVNVGVYACFSGDMAVQVLGKGEMAMKDLQVGDEILTGAGTYSPVYAFGHFAPNTSAEFLQIHLTGDRPPLLITKEHMVFINDKADPVRADALDVGDMLQDQLQQGMPITAIERVPGTGLYAPLTVDGTLVAGGIVVSSYIAFFDHGWDQKLPLSQHDYVHLGLSPFRLICRMGSTVSLGWCQDYNQEGFPSYVNVAVKVNQWVREQNIFVQFATLMLVLLLTGICRLLEYVLLDAPWMLTLLVPAILIVRWSMMRSQGAWKAEV